MIEYIILIVSILILLLDNFFNFLTKPFLGAVLGALALALLHIIIKDAVVAAIKETKE